MGEILPIFKSSGKTFVLIQTLKRSASNVASQCSELCWVYEIIQLIFHVLIFFKTFIDGIFLNLNFDSVCLSCCVGEMSTGSISVASFSPV